MSRLMEEKKRYFQEYYLKNKKRLNALAKKNYQENREKYIEQTKQWRKANPDKVRLYSEIGRRKVSNHITRLWYAMNRRVNTQSSYLKREVKFSKQWFIGFCMENKQYKRLFNQWAKNGYPRKLVPTIDRIDNAEGYTKTNIQFLSFKDNSHKKYYDNRKLPFKCV